MNVLLYCGHHKCATRWLVDILTEACDRIGLDFYEAHNAGMFDRDLPAFLERRPVDVLAYTNARHQFLKDLSDYRGFHVIRDPRDILVSAYFSHLNSHPTDGWSALEEHRRSLQECSEEEGLALELDFIDDVFEALTSWDYDRPEMFELKMEHLVGNAYEGLMDVFIHLGLVDPEEQPLDRQLELASRREPGRTLQRFELLAIVHDHRFAKKSGGRAAGQEDRTSHYRKGKAGDWRNHFTPAVATAFAERHGELLIRLEYEADDGWWCSTN
jgi:hypothetical protein